MKFQATNTIDLDGVNVTVTEVVSVLTPKLKSLEEGKYEVKIPCEIYTSEEFSIFTDNKRDELVAKKSQKEAKGTEWRGKSQEHSNKGGSKKELKAVLLLNEEFKQLEQDVIVAAQAINHDYIKEYTSKHEANDLAAATLLIDNARNTVKSDDTYTTQICVDLD